MKDLESGSLSYTTVGEFLTDLKKEFSGRINYIMKMVELKKLKQESKTIEEFVQEFRRVARESRYKGQSLMEKFKQGINVIIRKNQWNQNIFLGILNSGIKEQQTWIDIEERESEREKD